MAERELKTVSFLVDQLGAGSPAQHLLDRFLVGYSHDGAYRSAKGRVVKVYARSDDEATQAAITRRVKDFGLVSERDPGQAVAGTQGVVIAAAAEEVRRELAEAAIKGGGVGGRCFVHGTLPGGGAGARRLLGAAESAGVTLNAGSYLPLTPRLPPVRIEPETAVRQALVVVQGSTDTAAVQGAEILLAEVERRQGGEKGVVKAVGFFGDDVWRAGKDMLWSWRLLGSAISRSDSPQGDPVEDGRTQDLVGLNLVPRLAKDPRCWVMEHGDGLRSAVLVLDGVVADYNFALGTDRQGMVSAQVFRPPQPAEQGYSDLSRALERWFVEGAEPWQKDRALRVAEVGELMARAMSKRGEWVEAGG